MKITLEEIISAVDDIPAIPDVVVKTVNLLNEKDIDASQIEKEILKDEGLTSTILKMANSAFYRGRSVVYTVRDAMTVLGFNTVRILVVSAAVSDVINKELAGYRYTKDLIWKQSQVCAYLSKVIAKKIGYTYPDTAYLVGLIRDIGMIILDDYILENKAIIESNLKSGYESQTLIEDEVLGYNHCDAGALLIKKWNLPYVLERGVRFHHNPYEVDEDNELQIIVHIADYLISKLEYFDNVEVWPCVFDERTLVSLGLDYEDLEQILADVNDEIEAGGMFMEA